jgi:cytidylate kinase
LRHFGAGTFEAYRGQGSAKKDVFAAGIAEIRNGLKGNPPFFVDAIISLDNLASQHVAAAVLSTAITDQVSKLAALQYIRKFMTGR